MASPPNGRWDEPPAMLFNSVEFIFLFLPVTLAGVYALSATG